MHSAVHVDVKLPADIAFVLSVGELRSGRNRPSVIGAFGKRYNNRTVLTLSALVNMRGCRLDPRDGNATAD